MRAHRVVLLLIAACSAPVAPRALVEAAESASLVAPAAAASAPLDAPTPVVPADTAAPAATNSAPSSASETAAPSAPRRRNVLLVTVDALRADMPWAGYPRDIAPNLTALEKQSVSYTRAYSISSYTAMSIGGLLGGRYPSELKRSGYFFSGHPDEEVLFPELLQKAGIRTMAAHAHFYFENPSGFRQGFDDYRIVPGIGKDRTTAREITSPQHLALAMDMLGNEANTSRPFFAWFHFLDPHDVYREHEGIKFGKKTRDKYDGEVFFTDRHLGKLFEFVRSQPWGRDTAILVTADHGEAFGEHGMYRHGFDVWEPLVRVPLIVHVPGVAPKRIEVPRSSIDLAPTIHELLGVPVSPLFQGRSLVAEVEGRSLPESRDVIVDLPRTSDNVRRRALIGERYKIVAHDYDEHFELFDLMEDPGEKTDLRRKRPDVFETMKRRYLERVRTVNDVCPKMRDKLKGRRKDKPC